MDVRENDEIFTTGAFLRPIKCVINGVEQWRWVVIGFENDNYFNGELINPMEYASHIKDLVRDWE
jgi:hypothetical protein